MKSCAHLCKVRNLFMQKKDSYCSGMRLKASIIAGINWFSLFKNEVDAINVFPVPDADTGKNIHSTFLSILEYLKKADHHRVWDVAEKSAEGALMGARGCSGIIISGFFKGFSEVVGSRSRLSALDLANCFKAASLKAYETVVEPREGTILTVAKDMANATLKAAKKIPRLSVVIKTAYEVARESLEATPKKLEILAKNGVVDAGGLGLVYFLEGMERYNFGRSIKKVSGDHTILVRPSFSKQTIPSRFCAELILSSNTIERRRLEDILTRLGDSLIISGLKAPTGKEMIYKIHIHTKEPKLVLMKLSELGRVNEIKVDDMQKQHLDSLKK